MPLYEYECLNGHIVEAFRSIDDRKDCPVCPCGQTTKSVVSAVMGFVSFPAAGGKGYVSPASGKFIDSAKARRDDFARTGTRPYEGFESESKEAKKRAKEEEKKSDAKLHDAVSKAYHDLPPSKRKVLG